MALEPIQSVRGRGVVVPGDDIDTDRIIPARYMKVVTFDGLGDYLFRDVRYGDDGRALDHPLDDPARRDATVMVSGRNFGCGSSREHAPQAIVRAGFRAVVADSFAEIFFGNATTLGLVCLALDPGDLAAVARAVDADPEVELVLDVEQERLSVAGTTYLGRLPATARDVLVTGRYDPLAELLAHGAEVDATAAALPYVAAEAS